MIGRRCRILKGRATQEVMTSASVWSPLLLGGQRQQRPAFVAGARQPVFPAQRLIRERLPGEGIDGQVSQVEVCQARRHLVALPPVTQDRGVDRQETEPGLLDRVLAAYLAGIDQCEPVRSLSLS